jgi:hypothetical protein
MYGTPHHHDVVKPEREDRLGRVQDHMVGRRRRRSITRGGGDVDHATFAIAAGAAILLQGR